MKSRAAKQVDLDRLREQFDVANGLFLMHFEKVQVVAIDDLRRKVRDAAGSYEVVKNTLARKAAQGTAVAGLDEHFAGPTAMVIVEEDAPRVAKALKEFAKTNPRLVFKGGIVEGATLSGADCEALADLPSKEELIGRLLFLLQSPLRRLATVLAAPSRNLAVVLQQVTEKKESAA